MTAILYAAAAAAKALANETAQRSPPDVTAIEAVTAIFEASPGFGRSRSALNGQPSSWLRPLQNSTFEPLRKYFSLERQRNIDQFLQALSDLAKARNRRAELVAIATHSWWPPTVDHLTVAAVLSQDLLCDRYEQPENVTISLPRRSNSHVKITVHETFTEHGQDRVLGKGQKTSVVTLIPENGRWVIDQVVSTVHDSTGTHVENLSELLRDAIKPLRKAERDISALPPPEVRKAIKADQ